MDSLCWNPCKQALWRCNKRELVGLVQYRHQLSPSKKTRKNRLIQLLLAGVELKHRQASLATSQETATTPLKRGLKVSGGSEETTSSLSSSESVFEILSKRFPPLERKCASALTQRQARAAKALDQHRR